MQRPYVFDGPRHVSEGSEVKQKAYIFDEILGMGRENLRCQMLELGS